MPVLCSFLTVTKHGTKHETIHCLKYVLVSPVYSEERMIDGAVPPQLSQAQTIWIYITLLQVYKRAFMLRYTSTLLYTKQRQDYGSNTK